ncbi:TPA: 5-methyltetrahydrofolate--homocysteine methyltransferase [Candidatus Sumerlaeota bacterium]|jgi:5-methyltetrahydrofolate--homocysteine methyltransferase|nr:5-methyltetrahydrofolate--homocysteine methyltransferase [Candidatus Sumerlaeota bacterium]
MNRAAFQALLKSKVLVLDGATGTQLQKCGMPQGVCPEKWVLENPESIITVQKNYCAAGSDAVYSCTFGGNRLKLEEFGLADQAFEMNRQLAQLSRQAAGPDKFVVGDLAPTGLFVRPLGDLAFDDLVDIYKEQVRGLLEGGVDFFVAETMMDIQEARAAVLAVKETCDLPICVSMTFNEDGRTLTGTDPVTALITLQSLGADAVGCNCSTGPDAMLRIIASMQPYATVPLMAKPNAGLPKLVDGKTVFDMKPEEFGEYVEAFVDLGVCLMGGCCGTSPEFIAQVSQRTENKKPIAPTQKDFSAVTSARETVLVGAGQPLAIVGERINPTGKKKLQADLKAGQTEEARAFAFEQVQKGAAILDVNVGMPGIDEKETMLRVVESVISAVQTPLCLDSSSPAVLEAALRAYPGRALINSVSAEGAKAEKLLPLIAKYGAMFIVLPLSDAGVPATADERIALVQQVYAQAEKYGLRKCDMVVDGITMTVSSDQKAAMETLKTVDWCANVFGCNTILGLSNISFGLPERSWVNTGFLAMCMGRGLSMAIANPSNEMLMNIKRACDVLAVRDANSAAYVAHFAGGATAATPKTAAAEMTTAEKIYDAVLKGNKEGIQKLITTALSEGATPSELVDGRLIPAITQVGDFYEQKKYYLPQLIQSAEAMKSAFELLEPLLQQNAASDAVAPTRVILATVKGDIHDIGKNIVGLMLKNYGFEVYDLGKDVSEQTIVQTAKEKGARIIGLSALMTTTMIEMKTVIALAKKEGLDCKFMVGGAVVTQQYADEIGADAYSEDAHSAVKVAQRLSV